MTGQSDQQSSTYGGFSVCVAPMMAYTDRHCRYLHRLISPSVRLFTEMVTCNALLHGPHERALAHDVIEHPVALQLGGNTPADLAAAARLGEAAGFDEINLNVGCPSSRVQEGRIGACLMAEPGLVADCYRDMARAVNVPVTVKCRLGIDDQNTDAFLDRFISALADAGCRTFYLHARIAILSGLSPAQNRSVPPLQYERVYALAARFPELTIVINGGIADVATVEDVTRYVDGVMIGRAAYQNPMLLGTLHERYYSEPAPSADDVFAKYTTYIQREYESGTPLSAMIRHALGLFSGRPGARRFRQLLSDAKRLKTQGPELLHEAHACLRKLAA